MRGKLNAVRYREKTDVPGTRYEALFIVGLLFTVRGGAEVLQTVEQRDAKEKMSMGSLLGSEIHGGGKGYSRRLILVLLREGRATAGG